MHRTQIYFHDDMFSRLQTVSRTKGISISEFIRSAVAKELQQDQIHSVEEYFQHFSPLESFTNVDPTAYVNELRSTSRIIDDENPV